MVGTTAATAAHHTVLITRVNRDIGKALALELAKRGHTIIGYSRSQDKLTSLHLQSELASASNSSDNNSNKHPIIGKTLALELVKFGLTIIGRPRSQDKLTSLPSELASTFNSSDNNINKHFIMNVDVV